ncbi:phosphotransferase family enzyme [Kribbella voronezhensis]|uniref:Phosphotransferase family enzyme n=1 Tax=Kribbella voronezhensis TaxID=2512212 RepID=A0A4R7T460_9ACTN|nr:phosphotransferase [Kribbella voronezhensis]TDU86604.1 phosphotransferase family enzyme [Kribbella voronezhensis]
MTEPPNVDYTATSARPPWSALPGELQRSVYAAVSVALGTEIASVGPSVSSGFTGGFAAPAHLANGRTVFIKSAPATMHAYTAYRREAEIVPQLPPAIRVPCILTTTTARSSDGEAEWFAVVSEGITARMPGMPWSKADFELVTANCEIAAEALSPSPIPELKPFVSDFGADGPSRVPAEIGAGARPLPPGFQPWLPERLEEIQHLVDLTPEALAGTAAVHGDLRPDNLLIDNAGQCWTVDWNWLTVGAPWIDWVGLLPRAQHQGINTLTAIRTNRLTTNVADDHLDSLIAALVAYVLEFVEAPPPPGCTPEIQRHRRLLGWCCLDWLAMRRGW